MRFSEMISRIYQFARISFMILLAAISLLMFVNGHPGFAFLLIISSLASLFIFTAFFTHYFIPELPTDTLFKLLVKTISQRFSSHKPLIHIVNGTISGDQTLPTIRKTDAIIHIDQNSAVISFDQKYRYNLMLTGIHILPRSAIIYAVLPTSLQRVIFGPESADSLSKARSGENLADFHVRVNTASKTAVKTADGLIIYPKFECFYRINIDQHSEEILALINRAVEEENSSTSALTIDFLQKVVFSLIMNQWRKISVGKTSEQLLNEVPYRLSQDGFAKNGLSALVYVREIFRED